MNNRDSSWIEKLQKMFVDFARYIFLAFGKTCGVTYLDWRRR